MKRLLTLLLAIAIASPLGATGQIPDILKISGKTYELNSNPLEAVLTTHPQGLPPANFVSTALWRGYIATWAVRDKRLYLDEVQVPSKDYVSDGVPESQRFQSALEHLFGNRDPRVATWFTGHLIVPTGKVIDYVHMGYGSTHSSYLVVTVVNGEVRQQRRMKRRQFEAFRRAQYEAFKRTPEYAAALAEAKSGDGAMADAQVDEFLFQAASGDYMSRIFD